MSKFHISVLLVSLVSGRGTQAGLLIARNSKVAAYDRAIQVL